MRALLLLALLLTLPLTAKAQSEDVILAMPEGQAILNISATERREVEQDLLVATLSFKSINKDPRFVQNNINEKMKEAVDTAKKAKEVKVNTGSYQVYEQEDGRTKETKWHGTQSLTLKSKNSEEILKLVGTLQSMGLTSDGLSYILAPETAVEVQDNLMEAALQQLQTRADRAAKALGKSTAELRDINVQGQDMPYQPMYKSRGMMMASADMEMAAPVAEAGESTITLTVNARVLLKP